LFSFGEASEEAALYAELFGCGQSQYPISYLSYIEWKYVEERLVKQLERKITISW
jgi:hypothetical protein